MPQKSGIAWALDPDKQGAMVWQRRIGQGSGLGGQWGGAVDERQAYFGIADLLTPNPGGMRAVNLATGEIAWSMPPQKPLCGEGRTCRAAQGAAVTVIPGAVLSGSLDGGMRAYSTADGEILWTFDTNREFQTVNGVKADRRRHGRPRRDRVGRDDLLQFGLRRLRRESRATCCSRSEWSNGLQAPGSRLQASATNAQETLMKRRSPASLCLSLLQRPRSRKSSPAGNPIVYGHHHVAASDIEAHKKFFAATLGGTAAKFGANNADIVKFPGVLVFFRAQKPTGGTIGTTVNHIGFGVPDLRATVNKIKAAGYTMITRTSVADNIEVKDDVATTAAGGQIAFVMGPDDVKVELVQVKGQTQPIALHHVHFFGQQNAEMRAWYEKTFGAKPRQGGGFLAADLPGVALNFTQSPEATVGTSGRSIDHIGFEVKGLEAFTQEPRGAGHQADGALSQRAGAQPVDRLHQRPVGHVDRAD